MQGDLNDPAMRNHQHFAVLMTAEDLVQRGADARVEGGRAFAAWDDVPIRFFDPVRPCLGKSFGDLLRAQTLPLAEIDLTKRLQGLGSYTD